MKEILKKVLAVVLSLCILAGTMPLLTLRAGAIDYSGLTKIVSLNFEAYPQTREDSCGSAAAKAVLRYFGYAEEVTDADLHEVIQGVAGRIASQLNSYLGPDTYVYKTFSKGNGESALNAIKQSLTAGNPAIIWVGGFDRTYFPFASSGHYTTVAGLYTDNSGNYWLELKDSYSGRYTSADNDYRDHLSNTVLLPFSTAIEYMEYSSSNNNYSIVIYSTTQRCDHTPGLKLEDGTWKFETKKKDDGTWAAFCRVCGREYILPELDTSKAGIYKFNKLNSNDDNSNGIGSQPYSNACDSCGIEGFEETVTGSVINAYGNEWYKTAKNKYVYSGYLSYVRALPKPSTPTGISGVWNYNSSTSKYDITLNWSSVAGATKYIVNYKASDGNWTELDESNGKTGTVTTNSVVAHGFSSSRTSVDFQIIAVNSAGMQSSPAEATIYKDVATYTVTYNANGGTGAPSSQTKTHGVNLTLSSTKPTRTNASAGNYTVTLNANGGNLSTTSLTAARTTSYSFKNWNTASNGSGTSYNAGGTYTANASATLYAQWNSSTTTAAVTLPTPTRSGYTFKGWATSTSASSGVTGSYTPTGNVTLYATWEKVYYLDVNITLDGKEIANAWDGWASFDVYINGKEDRKAVGDYYSEWPSGTEYEIKNIMTTAGKVYNGVIAGSLKGKITGDTSIMLSFSSQYTVTFNPNDGSVSPTTKTVTYGHTYGDLPTPTRIGYTFAGWFTAASGGNQVTASTTVNLTTNQTLYAHWAAIPVTSIKLNKYSVSLSVGETYTLTGTVSPSDAADTRVHWWSDNTSVVTVDQNGKITAVGAGSAVIVAEAYGGDNIKANCTVTVTEYYLRLRGFLNQTDWNDLGSYGTADIYINGKLVKDDVAEYVVCWPAGTTYEIKDIKANEGYVYEGVKAGSLTGTIDAAHTDVVLSFSKLYTVTYDANGGIGAPAVQEKTHGTELILSTVEPTRDGYTFLGWAESADATEAKYHPGDAYSFNESITLYAVWEENAEVEFLDCYAYLDTGWGDDEYMLRLSFRNNREAQAYGIDYLIDAYGNDIPSGADSLDKNANVLPFFTPLEPGVHNCLICIHYVDEDVEGGNLVEGQTYRWRGYVTIDGKTYYSQELSFVFTLDGTRFPNHTVTFNANGGENAPEPQIKNYKTPLTLTMDEPSFDGHTFIGWAADKEATEATYQPGDLYFRNANITLYAVWEENETPKPDGGVICVGSTTGRAGDAVDIAISLKDNPGVISMLLNVNYDNSVLTLTGYTDEGKLGTEYHNKNYSIMPYILSWADDTATTDNTYTGTIVTLHFKISDNAAEGNYPITISYSSDDSDIYNSDWETVEFSIENGSVTVSNVVLGDVNGDGKVNGMDRTFLARHVAKWAGYSSDDIVYSAADVNGDGKVNGMDRTFLARYVAKWSGYEELIPYKPNMKLPELSTFNGNVHEPESATDGQAAISVEKTEAVAGETVEIDISLENNPGIISMLLSVSYDSEALTLTGYTDAGKLGTEYHNKDYSMNPYILSWADDTATSDNKYSGVIVTLHFTVSENAAVGSYPITVSYSKDNADIYNSNWETVDFSLEQGSISVKDQSPVENVYTVSGTAAFWNDTDNAEYYLYSAETADADIRAAWQAGTHTELEGIEDYAVTKGEIEAATVDGKTMKAQSFSFEAVKAGEYKLAIFKPGKYVPKIVTVTVTNEAVELGSVKLWLYGDVNCDGSVDSKDATQITRYANLKSSVFDTGDDATRADRLLAADVSGDGSVDSKDATQITRFANLKSSIFDKLK